MGSGNHFVELQRVARIFDEAAAAAYGLREDHVTVLIHSGSRGLGHQVCSDYVKRMDAVMRRYAIDLPAAWLEENPLAAAELDTETGRWKAVGMKFNVNALSEKKVAQLRS